MIKSYPTIFCHTFYVVFLSFRYVSEFDTSHFCPKSFNRVQMQPPKPLRCPFAAHPITAQTDFIKVFATYTLSVFLAIKCTVLTALSKFGIKIRAMTYRYIVIIITANNKTLCFINDIRHFIHPFLPLRHEDHLQNFSSPLVFCRRAAKL